MEPGVVPGTFVMEASRPQRLCHDVEAGDLVLGPDPAGDGIGVRRVVETAGGERRLPGNAVLLVVNQFEDPRLLVHPETGVLTPRGWVLASELQAGGQVLAYYGGARCVAQTLLRVEKRSYSGPLHSLVLDGVDHTFFANHVAVRGGRWS